MIKRKHREFAKVLLSGWLVYYLLVNAVALIFAFLLFLLTFDVYFVTTLLIPVVQANYAVLGLIISLFYTFDKNAGGKYWMDIEDEE